MEVLMYLVYPVCFIVTEDVTGI